MTAEQFYWAYGVSRCREVAEKAGTDYAYFYELVIRKRRPSIDLAKKLSKASGGEMSAFTLINVEKRK